MRIVKWNPQERVDTPDLTAMSYLVLGDFRRTVRGAVLGEDANYIIRGFKVEPAAVPDTTIRVRLDVSSVLSFAFGAELIGARVDYGQVIGGDDSAGNLEGNATQTYDFTGDPAATYTVQMRFEYADGTVDNRAFWNPSTNSEFISAVNTRTLPSYQIRVTGAPSGEWIDLADVVWDGVGPINTGDITDLREFAFEGTSPFFATSVLTTGGMPQFSRSFDRATNGLNAIYPALRGLARQIQDIKGADESGTWNWFNTPYRPGNPTGSLSVDKATNLRSLRTSHFTVGDGVKTYGDFTGTALGSGLDECLAHIETQQASFVNDHIVITILDENDSTYNIADYAFTDMHVEIIGRGGNSSGRVTVNHSTVAAGTYVLDSSSGLTLRNIELRSGSTASNRAGIRVTTGQLLIENCIINPGLEAANPETSTVYALNFDTNSDLFIRDSTITGRVNLDHPETSPRIMGVITDTYFASTCIEIPTNSNSLRFVNCEFDDLNGGYTAAAVAGAGNIQIDDNVSEVHFVNCTFRNGTSETDAVRIEGNSLIGPRDISFSRCTFELSTSTREPNTGANGALGTGWGIFIDDNSSTTEARHISVLDCIFDGALMIDSGAIFCEGATYLTVRGCDFTNFGANSAPTATSRCPVVFLDGTGAPSADTRCLIDGNQWGNWSDSHSAADTYYCIQINDANNVSIVNNHFDGKNASAAIIDGTAASCAIEITDCDAIHIRGNTFNDFQSGTTDRRGIKFVSVASTLFNISDNSFDVVGQAPIDLSGVASTIGTISNNTIRNISATGTVGIDINASATNLAVNSNVFSFFAVAVGIDFNGASGNAFVGNVGGNANIDEGGGTNSGSTANNAVNSIIP